MTELCLFEKIISSNYIAATLLNNMGIWVSINDLEAELAEEAMILIPKLITKNNSLLAKYKDLEDEVAIDFLREKERMIRKMIEILCEFNKSSIKNIDENVRVTFYRFIKGESGHHSWAGLRKPVAKKVLSGCNFL